MLPKLGSWCSRMRVAVHSAIFRSRRGLSTLLRCVSTAFSSGIADMAVIELTPERGSSSAASALQQMTVAAEACNHRELTLPPITI